MKNILVALSLLVASTPALAADWDLLIEDCKVQAASSFRQTMGTRAAQGLQQNRFGLVVTMMCRDENAAIIGLRKQACITMLACPVFDTCTQRRRAIQTRSAEINTKLCCDLCAMRNPAMTIELQTMINMVGLQLYGAAWQISTQQVQ